MKPCLALVALVALVSAGCGGSSTEEIPAPDVVITTDAAGEPVPPIEGITLDGERLALADLIGRLVFVNVWASW